MYLAGKKSTYFVISSTHLLLKIFFLSKFTAYLCRC